MVYLDDLAIKYGTDKKISEGHGYTKYYAEYFDNIRLNKLNFLELGVREGWSLKMWHEYFQNGLIYGIDNNMEGKCPDSFNEERVIFKLCSQDDEEFLTNLSNEVGGFDIIIDDASHISPLSIKSFEILFPLLKPGGIYVIEDLHVCDMDIYKPYGPSVIEYIHNNIKNYELINNKICFIRKI